MKPQLFCYRDGAVVHINYKGQFSDKPAARGRKSAAARDGPAHQDADEGDDELLDLEAEEDQGQYSGRSGSHRGNPRDSSGQEEEGPQAEGTPGRWATHNNHKVNEICCDGCLCCMLM